MKKNSSCVSGAENSRIQPVEWKFFVAIFIVLLTSYIYIFPRWADPNQNSRLDMIVAVVDDGTFQIDPYVSNTVDYAKVGDHYYSDKAPGTAFLGIPIYALLKNILNLPVMDAFVQRLANIEAFNQTLNVQGTGVSLEKVRFALLQVVATVLLSAIPSALTGGLIFLFSMRIIRSTAYSVAAAIVYGLLTPVFAYAGALYGHQLSAAFLFGVFFLIYVHDNFSVLICALSGLILGMSVITEFPSLLAVIIIFLYLAYKLKKGNQLSRLLWTIALGGVVAVLWMVYNNSIFGSPFSLGYSYSELWETQHQTGFMSLSVPRGDALWGITFSSFRGLFFYSPILLFSLAGFIFWYFENNNRPEFWTFLLISFALLLFNASSVMWWGGFAVGPRYLLPSLPFMAFPIVFALKNYETRKQFYFLFAIFAFWSWAAVWSMTIAGQSFPSDVLKRPLVQYALPNLLSGNVARNIGTIAGIRGAASLIPLLLFLFSSFIYLFLNIKKSSNYPTEQDL